MIKAEDARKRSEQHYNTKLRHIQEKILNSAQKGDSKLNITEDILYMSRESVEKLVADLQSNGFVVATHLEECLVSW